MMALRQKVSHQAICKRQLHAKHATALQKASWVQLNLTIQALPVIVQAATMDQKQRANPLVIFLPAQVAKLVIQRPIRF